MRLFLIRHAESEHNVAQLLAGATDSALTNHGMLQVGAVAEYFKSNSINFDRVFASDLSRARNTALGICQKQLHNQHGEPLLTPIISSDLRERSYGSLEGKPWQKSARATEDPATAVDSETVLSMRKRAISFLNEHILPSLFESPDADTNIAIVSHGGFLRVFWNRLVELFDPMNISLATGVESSDSGPAAFILPSWSNTGFMELSIQPGQGNTGDTHPDPEVLLNGWIMKIIAVDSKEHLNGLHRTRGGIGSAKHDSRQKNLDQFFKK
ncbi:hypothetical protein N7493_005694 [Penicillium malachiteum]|uniref:Phosphoglycerate mutase family protein n=1 Tax=Penicillium malachiteum TaxID=1324776 RepID=A0AAD6MWT2_9EURO|nr:hypothetical protein N7493_005694 [Penicillium malachiteum]